MGVKTLLPWRLGTGAKGNEGVAKAVRATKNSIGYVEYAQATQLKLSTALIRNRAGQFVTPDTKTFQAAAASAEWSKTSDFNLMLTNAPGDEAYPITATVFVLMHKQPSSPRRSRSALTFFRWALEKGSRDAAALGYVPLPPALVGQVVRVLVEVVPGRFITRTTAAAGSSSHRRRSPRLLVQYRAPGAAGFESICRRNLRWSPRAVARRAAARRRCRHIAA